MPFSVDAAPLGPIPVPMLPGTWLQAGDVTDFTRLEPRPMPDIVAFFESELYGEIRGDKVVFAKFTHVLMIYGLKIEPLFLASLLEDDLTDCGSAPSTRSTWSELCL